VSGKRLTEKSHELPVTMVATVAEKSMLFSNSVLCFARIISFLHLGNACISIFFEDISGLI